MRTGRWKIIGENFSTVFAQKIYSADPFNFSYLKRINIVQKYHFDVVVVVDTLHAASECHSVTKCHRFFIMWQFKWIKSFTAAEKASKSGADGADFEEAILQTGYGKFNIIVLLIVLPCCTSNVFDTTTMSIILPSAECDLNLSLQDKGMLNAITYMGEFVSCESCSDLRSNGDDRYWFDDYVVVLCLTCLHVMSIIFLGTD